MYEDRVFLARSDRLNRRSKFIRIVRWIRFIAVVLFITSGIVLIAEHNTTSTVPEAQVLISPLEDSVPLKPPAFSVLAQSNELEHIIQNTLVGGTSGQYGIVVKHLATNETYVFNEHKSYWSGSLYKLWVMAVVYDLVKKGTLNSTQVLTEAISVLNDKFHIASNSAEKKEGTISHSVDDALFKMITISDNYAALLLAAKVRLATVSNFLKSNNFNESKVGGGGNSLPVTTPADVALFYEKLYRGNLIDKEYSEKMLQLLRTQRLNDKIPKYLPKNISIAHKTGELDQFSHDAGIVYSPGGDYIIVVLSESGDPIQADERIARISEAVYNYFVSKQAQQ